MHIPTPELRITFARSSGAGGQNVNKTSTKATVHWPIGCSRVLSLEQKARVREKLSNKINWSDELVVVSEQERTQAQNRDLAVARLQALVSHALIIPKKRRPTRPTKASKIRRLETKIHRSRVKMARRGSDE